MQAATRGAYSVSEPFRWSDGSTPDAYHFWSAATALTDDDIELGEGLAIVFVDPAVAPRLDLTESAAHFLPRFLSSDRYPALARAAGRP